MSAKRPQLIGLSHGARWIVLLFALVCSPLVRGHHSGAMFDDRKSITLVGTVRQFQWANPHCWIQLTVPKEGEAAVEWSIEMGSTTELYRSGWRPTTISVGQRISVVVHPARDGSAGALFVSATGDDGSPIGKSARDTSKAAP